MKYLIFIAIVFLASCNPCKYVTKHPECFPSDTILITNEVIHYEKEYITNDSIILDTVPCNPITNTYYKTRTEYITKLKVKIDTIITNKETVKINPLNEALKKSNDKLELKLKRHNKVIVWLIIALAGIVLLILGYIKLK